MSVVVKGSQTELIKRILEDRDFVLSKVIADETLTPADEMMARHMFGSYGKDIICGIREEGALDRRNQSDFLLALGHSRFAKETPWHEEILRNIRYEIGSLGVDEFLDFMKGKELFFETNYFGQGGGYEEGLVNAFCEKVLLLKRREDIYLTDDSYQVNIFLQKIGGDETKTPNSLTPVSTKDFAIYDQVIKSLGKIVCDHAGLDNSDIVLNFETKDANLNAGYFIARYHSNTAWDMNPVNILRLRIAVFLLPGELTDKESKNISVDKLTEDKEGNLYKLDSIHFYSDICFTLKEFEELVDWHLSIIDMA